MRPRAPGRGRALAALATAGALVATAAGASGAPSPPHTARPTVTVHRAAGSDPVPILVTMRAGVRPGEWDGPDELVRALRRTAARSRHALAGRLEARPDRRLWLVNAVALRAGPAEIARLARNPAVARIDPDPRVRVASAGTFADEAPAGVFGRGGWGLAAIGAPAVWCEHAVDGSGVRVGSIDTGVDAGHPDLAGKVVAWRDFVHGRPLPYDDSGHGTHTIGTVVGGRAGGAPIGVAPGATVIVAKALGADGTARLSTLLAAAEWMADPDGNPATSDQPAVVSASWGTPGDASGEALRAVIRRWRELGIVPVFAAGNSGPRGHLGVPAAYDEVLAVGAVGPRERVAGLSSRGWAAADRPAPGPRGRHAKPDLAAPGLEVLSSAPGGDWVGHGGTSMAAPHVAGTVALLRQADPRMPVSAVEGILRRTARDLSPSGPDPAAGAGLVDARAAVTAVLGPRPSCRGLEVIAIPPATTNQLAPAFSVSSGAASVAAWVDGERVPGQRAGPLVRVPVPTAGRHTIELALVGPTGEAVGARRRVGLVIDRTPPVLRLSVRRTGLLRVAWHATATDAVSGVRRGSVRSRLSDGGARVEGAGGRHAFGGPGPYWLEARAADRAGNVARVRRRVAWPRDPVRRRLAGHEAGMTLRLPFLFARLRRNAEGRYDSSRVLARFLEANVPAQPFAAIRRPTDPPPRGAVGVYSDARRRLRLSVEVSGRRYFLEDSGGRVGRGVVALR